FFRHAADVDAGAAEPAGLDDRGPGPMPRGALRTRESAAAAANGDQIEFGLRHCELRPEYLDADDILWRHDHPSRPGGAVRRGLRVPDRHLQRARRLAREREGVVGEHRRTAEAAS